MAKKEYIGDGPSGVAWSSAFGVLCVLQLSGLVAITGIIPPDSIPELAGNKPSKLLLITLFSALMVLALSRLALSYVIHSAMGKKKGRCLPHFASWDDDDSPAFQKLVGKAAFLYVPILNILFLHHVYRSAIFDDRIDLYLGSGNWLKSRMEAAQDFHIMNVPYSVGKSGVDYFPVITDFGPLILWGWALITVCRWARICKRRQLNIE